MWLSLALCAAGSVWFAIALHFVRRKRAKERGLVEGGGGANGHTRSRAVAVALLYLLVVALVPTILVNGITRLAFYRSVRGTAQWRQSGPQAYLRVEAQDHYSLGYLEGKMLAHRVVNAEVLLSTIVTGEYREMAREFLQFIPKEYAEEMRGIADGATHATGWIVTFEDVLLQNVFVELYYGRILPAKHGHSGGGNDVEGDTTSVESAQAGVAPLQLGCTVVGGPGPGGVPTVGQNFDFVNVVNDEGPLENGWLPSLAFVLHQLPGKPAVFDLRLGGMLALPCGKNSLGVTALINYVSCKLSSNASVPITVRTRQAWEAAGSAQEFLDVLVASPHTASFNYLLADSDEIIGLQAHPAGYRVQHNATIVHTNRYVYADWNEEFFAGGDYALTRQAHAEWLLGQAIVDDGVLDHGELLAILGNGTDGAGPESAIDRTGGVMDSATVAFFTSEAFGLGDVHDGVGPLPAWPNAP